MEPYQLLRLLVGVDFGIKEMKEYSSFPKSPGLETYHQMQFRVTCLIFVLIH